MDQGFKNILDGALQSHLHYLSNNCQFAASEKLCKNEVFNVKSCNDNMASIPVSLEVSVVTSKLKRMFLNKFFYYNRN
jgi:hypothetical protein